MLLLLGCLLALVGGTGDENGLHKLVIPVPNERMRAHFRIPAHMPLPATPDRVTNITREQFREYAIRGQPVIVTDGMRDWGGRGKWTCDYFHHTFPNEDVGGFTAYKADALKWRKKLGDPWFLTREALGTPQEEADPKNPTVMSWYFSALGVDGTRGHEIKRNETVSAIIREDLRVPYFLDQTPLNRDTVFGRVEFFFGTDGAGVHPHTDPVCQWIFSGQASGRKSWRLSLPYNIDALERANPSYRFRPSDGNTLLAIMANKAPLYEFTLLPGELMFFPPGMIHTTKAVGPECSTSLSLQFASPNPVQYLKEFSTDLVSDIIGASKCYLDHFNAWLFGDRLPARDASPAALRVFCDLKFAEMDLDKSEAISPAEALVFYTAMHADGSSAGGLIVDDAGLDADSFVLAHDTNQDGLVSKHEFDALVFALWTPRMAQVAVAVNKPQAVSYFFQADGDGDDYITRAEMGAAFPDADWLHLLQYDDDRDGRIFQGEFHRHTKGIFELMTGKRYDVDALEEGDEDEDEVGGVTGSASETAPIRPLAADPPPPAAGLRGLALRLPLEAELRQLWGIAAAQGQLPVAPLTVSAVTPERFRKLARRGQPLVVTDGLRPGSVRRESMTCEAFKRDFAQERLKSCRGCRWKRLGDTSAAEAGVFWEFQGLGQSTVLGDAPAARSAEQLQRVRGLADMPYFVPDSRVNRLLHDDYFHAYFGTPGGSRGPFTDMSCFWNLFGQVHGSSRWRVTVPFSVKQLQADNADYIHFPPDGAVLVERMLDEHPVYEFTLEEGQALVLPPGLFKHFTMRSANCSVLYRTAFMDPAPVTYLQTLQEPLMSDSEGAAGCYTDHYNRWLLGSILPESDGSHAGNARFASSAFRVLDADGDGRVTEAEAQQHFPPEAEEGAVRTPELDGTSFVAANDADLDGAVTAAEFEASVQRLWNPVMREVGGMWYFVDQRNAQEGGNWAQYGRYVDSIRFRYGEALTVDGSGLARPVPAAAAAAAALPAPFPQGAPRGLPVPEGFGWLVERHAAAHVVVARQRGDGTAMAFYVWPSQNKSFAGLAQGGRRLGLGVYCCRADGELHDQVWRPGDDDGRSFLLEPPSGGDAGEQQSEAEIVSELPGLLWMGIVTLNGPIAIRWTATGDFFVGTLARGRREGPGVFVPGGGGPQELVTWLPGQDTTDWSVLLDLNETQ